jgi:hypothetical protein
MKEVKLYTREQNLRFLIDDALFSDSKSARTSAVKELARDYKTRAIPVIQDIIKTLPENDQEFMTFCANIIAKIREEDQRNEISAGE